MVVFQSFCPLLEMGIFIYILIIGRFSCFVTALVNNDPKSITFFVATMFLEIISFFMQRFNNFNIFIHALFEILLFPFSYAVVECSLGTFLQIIRYVSELSLLY